MKAAHPKSSTGRAAGLGAAAFLAVVASASPVPEDLFFDGKVVTVDAGFTVARAFAVSDGGIIAVGTDEAVRRLAGPRHAASRPGRPDGAARPDRLPHPPDHGGRGGVRPRDAVDGDDLRGPGVHPQPDRRRAGGRLDRRGAGLHHAAPGAAFPHPGGAGRRVAGPSGVLQHRLGHDAQLAGPQEVRPGPEFRGRGCGRHGAGRPGRAHWPRARPQPVRPHPADRAPADRGGQVRPPAAAVSRLQRGGHHGGGGPEDGLRYRRALPADACARRLDRASVAFPVRARYRPAGIQPGGGG